MNAKITRYFTAVWGLMKAYIRRLFRDKVALFFTFLFPVLFLFVFGSINRGSGDISFTVAVINNSDSSFSQQFIGELEKNETFKIKEDVTTLDDARERMGRGEIDTIIEAPEGFGEENAQGVPAGKLNVYYEEASPQGGQTIAAVLQGTLDGINKQFGQPDAPLSVEQKSTATENLSSFDYIFSGLLGFTILSLGIFGLANAMPAEKKTGAFRRLRAAPIGASQLVLANAGAYLVSGLLSLVLMFVVATQMFDFTMRGDYLTLLVFIIFSIFVMFGFGLAIGGWAKNENQSAPLTNVVALPLMFLSGVFFPRFLFPEWLQGITGYLPLTPIVDGIRYITTEGARLIDLGPQLLILLIWGVVIYIIAFKFFRWE